jgi:hypothetical protein
MWLLRPLPLLAVAVALCLAVAGGVTLLGGAGPVTRPATAPAAAPTPAAPTTGDAADPGLRLALEVLDSWDRSRAAAYSSGDLAALRRLYVRGSAAGRNDVRMLREYVDRGLAVRGLELQRAEVDLLSSSGRRLRVEVLERLAGATVVPVAAPGTEVALPRDRPERRIVTFRRPEGRWQVAAVVRVDGPSAGRPGSGR